MSFTRTRAVWELSKAESGELLVLLALADYENEETGQLNPRIETLAKKARMGIRQCKTYLGRLQKRQELSVKRTRGASHYTINLSIQEVQNPAPLKQIRSAESRTTEVQNPAPLEVQNPAHRTYNPNQERKDPLISPTPWGKKERRFKSKGTESGESDCQRQPAQNMCPGDPAKVSARTAPPSTPKIRRNPKELSADVLNLFERFYAAYPKRVSRGQAEKAWLTVERNNEVNEAFMLALIGKVNEAKQTANWMKEGGKYVPNPATWLNAKGWLDEYRPIQTERRAVL